MLSLSGTAKIGGGVRDMKTSFPGFHPTTDFEQPTDVHIADNLIWSCKMLFKLFIKIVLSVLIVRRGIFSRESRVEGRELIMSNVK